MMKQNRLMSPSMDLQPHEPKRIPLDQLIGSASCKKCWGKGYEIFLEGGGRSGLPLRRNAVMCKCATIREQAETKEPVEVSA